MGPRRSRARRAIQRWQEFDAQRAGGGENLARTSRTPGRTRALNFFAVGDDLAIVDLPGYGFAKMARTEAARIASLMNDYLGQSERLVGLVLLVDARRGPEREELDLATLAAGRGVKLIAVATKCDKLRRSERAAALARFKPLGVEPILSRRLTARESTICAGG